MIRMDSVKHFFSIDIKRVSLLFYFAHAILSLQLTQDFSKKEIRIRSIMRHRLQTDILNRKHNLHVMFCSFFTLALK